MSDWTDGQDPYAATARAARRRDGRYAISDSAWAMHLLGLQQPLPGLELRVDDRRAADAARGQGRRRARAARRRRGAAADAAFEEILLRIRFAGPPRDRRRRRPRRPAARARPLRRSTSRVVGSGPNGANPHHEVGERTIEDGDMVVLDFGGLKDGYGSDITRTVHVGEPTAEEREVHEVVRARPAGRRSRPCARGSPARRSTAPRAR